MIAGGKATSDQGAQQREQTREPEKTFAPKFDNLQESIVITAPRGK